MYRIIPFMHYKVKYLRREDGSDPTWFTEPVCVYMCVCEETSTTVLKYSNQKCPSAL